MLKLRSTTVWPRLSMFLGAMAALGFCVSFALSGRPLPGYLSGWRGWDDLAIASTFCRDGAFPVGPYEIANRYRRTSPEFRAFRRPLMRTFRDRPVTDALTAVDVDELVAERAYPVTRVDDAGRAFFLSILFKLTGGVRPLFLVWLPIGLVAAALGWLVCELALRGWFAAAALSGLAFCLSSFFREASAQSYAAYGFYLTAGLALMAFAVAMSGPPPRRLLMRIVPAVALLCVAAPARNAVFLMAPAFVLALSWSAWRGRSWRHRAGTLLLGVTAFLGAPRLAEWSVDLYSAASLRATGRENWPSAAATGHDIWPTLWIGLGDFDRTRGHVHLDEAARSLVVAAGFADRLEPGAQEHLKKLIVADITSDPLWFGGILAKRAKATFLLEKLWPSARDTGKPYAPITHPNEGAFDSCMELAPTADQFGWGPKRVEVPGWLLWIGWPLLALATVVSRKLETGRYSQILLPVALGFLACPMVVTTASAIEMQAMAGAHYLAWALAIDRFLQRLSLTGTGIG